MFNDFENWPLKIEKIHLFPPIWRNFQELTKNTLTTLASILVCGMSISLGKWIIITENREYVGME